MGITRSLALVGFRCGRGNPVVTTLPARFSYTMHSYSSYT